MLLPRYRPSSGRLVGAVDLRAYNHKMLGVFTFLLGKWNTVVRSSIFNRELLRYNEMSNNGMNHSRMDSFLKIKLSTSFFGEIKDLFLKRLYFKFVNCSKAATMFLK